jgi:hypothetical protein
MQVLEEFFLTENSVIKKECIFERRLSFPKDLNRQLYMGSGLLERKDEEDVYSGTVVVAGEEEEEEGVERSWDRLSAWERWIACLRATPDFCSFPLRHQTVSD